MPTPPIGILATGSCVPDHELGNVELAERFDVTTEWIERKTRILTRRHVALSEAASDLAVRAATGALRQAGLSPEDIDFIVVPTTTGDRPLPPTACLVQSTIGAHRAACFDINIGCSGFVYGLAVARGLVTVKPALALVVAVDVWSRFIDPMDRGTAVLLGDGAGAAVVGPVPDGYGILDSDLLGYGDEAELLHIPNGGSRSPASTETVASNGHVLHMQGRAVSEFVLAHVPPSVKEVLNGSGVRPDQIDHFVPHQANGVLLDKLAEEIGLSNASIHTTIRHYGNSGAASLPVTLDRAHRSGVLHDGDLVLLSGFGGGMAVGSSLLRWHERGDT